jgi:3-isopropylmalate dehydrogenase
MLRVALIPGDGIGPEVTDGARRALEAACAVCGRGLRLVGFDYGAERYLHDGVTLPADALERFRAEFDAILLGALGDPRVADDRHAREILFGIRLGLDLYCNIRPTELLDRRLTPLRETGAAEPRFTIFRENTEDLYVGIGGVFKRGTPDEVAVQESIATRKGVDRILEAAFRHAAERGLARVTMADKSNALRFSGDLWTRAFEEVGRRYPQIVADHRYVDALALELVRTPGEFEVIVTSNLFGDILSDLAAGLVGGLGVAASGNVHPGRLSLFEPVHGSAPALAGRDVANPIGAVLSAAMLLEHVGAAPEAALIRGAVRASVRDRECTPDIGGALGTREATGAICRRILSTGPQPTS